MVSLPQQESCGGRAERSRLHDRQRRQQCGGLCCGCEHGRWKKVDGADEVCLGHETKNDVADDLGEWVGGMGDAEWGAGEEMMKLGKRDAEALGASSSRD